VCFDEVVVEPNGVLLCRRRISLTLQTHRWIIQFELTPSIECESFVADGIISNLASYEIVKSGMG
jgi:hypothetical protein